MKANTEQTLSQFLLKELGMKLTSKKDFLLTKRLFSHVALLSQDPSQTYYRNDKFVVGLELREKELDSALRMCSLWYRKATQEDILLLVKAVASFCHKKGWSIARGRPKEEAETVTISAELYK